MCKTVLILVLGSIGSAVCASTWVPVAQESEGAVLLDADTVQRSGATVTVWVELKRSQSEPTGIGYEIDHWSIDCAQMTLASLATVQFTHNGRRTGSNSDYYPQRVPIIPKSIGFDVYRLVCR